MKIFADNLPLLEGKERTYLSQKADAADTTLTVQNGLGFGLSEYILIGNFGDENAEIVTSHAATAATVTTITTGALAKNHSVDDPVTALDYNQVEFSRATTLTGGKSVLTTSAIDADCETTIYDDTSNSTGFAFIRFKHSGDTAYSDYSAGVNYTGYDLDTVHEIKKTALRRNNYKIESDSEVSEDDLLAYVNECQEEVWIRKSRLSCFEEKDTDTDTVAGTETVAVMTGFTPRTGRLVYDSAGNRQPLVYLSRQKYLQVASTSSSGVPLYYNVFDNLIYLWPTPSQAKALDSYFFKKPATISSETDTVIVPAPIVRWYVSWMIALARLDEKRANKFEQRYNITLEQYIADDVTSMPEDGGVVEVEDMHERYEDDIVF